MYFPIWLVATEGLNRTAQLHCGCTRSWDSPDPPFFQVVIDNMMNLEVLFASYAWTGNSTLVDIAVLHADRTLLNHVKPNGLSRFMSWSTM